jgi:hypothetical protein
VANRKRLDRRFKVLAFTIRTYGNPWFEVLLTTDKLLFDPAAAGRRTPANFYASREHGGVSRASGDDIAYVVPAAVIGRFADARPRPSEIFYTVASYATPDGVPTLAQPPATLALGAPSVRLAADFHAGQLATVLCVPAEKLRPMVDHGTAASFVAQPSYTLAEDWTDVDELAMAQAADAWMSDPHALSLDNEDPPEPYPEAAESPDDVWSEPAAALADAWAEPAQGPDDPWPEEATAYEEEPGVEPYDGAYEDGYEEEQLATEDEPWAEAEESSFPADAAEPAQLEDDDDELAATYEEPYDTEDYGLAVPYTNGNGAAPEMTEPEVVATALDIPAKVALMQKLGRLFESSGGYAGINADTEFRSRTLPQAGRWHVGLSYGFVQFTQDSGALGRLLQMMRQRDGAEFRRIFGADADELVRVTSLPGPGSRNSPGGRSARVQPVAGHDLWEEPWLSRFRAAGAHPPFQAAQNELAVRMFLDPMLGLAEAFGLDTERGVAMLTDRAIQMGLGGAKRWLVGAIGPIRTDALRQQALSAVGAAGVREFQQAGGLRADGAFGPDTHVALVRALRRLGAASPVPIPTREQLLDAIVARAEQEQTFWRRRPSTIRTSREFADAPLAWVTAPAPRP